MTYPVFVDNGAITPDGKRLVEFVVAQFEEADRENNVAALNNLSGPIAEYYVNVHKLGSLTPEKWLKDMSHSARNAYDIMQYVEAQALKESAAAQATADTANAVSGLEAELTKLKESIAEQVAKLEQENVALRQELEALHNPTPAKGKGAKKPAEGEGEAAKPENETPETE